MQRYELIEGKSSKFWEVEVSGSDLTVRYGRIGTSGQRKSKTFADATAAKREMDKLVKEKTGKGYLKIDGQNIASPNTAQSLSVPVTPTPVRKGAPARATPVPAIVDSAATSLATATPPSPQVGPVEDIAWPRGGFQWEDEWRKAMPVVRGIRAHKIEDQSLLAESIVLPNDSFRGKHYLPAIGNAVGRSWTYWGKTISKERITEERLNSTDFEFWLELMAQAHCAGWENQSLKWVTHQCAKRHGMPFSIDAMLSLYQAERATDGMSDSVALFEQLRYAIVVADETDYQEAERYAGAIRGKNSDTKIACAHLFPNNSAWAIECVEQQLKDTEGLLKECVMPADVFVRYLKANPQYFQSIRSALFLQVHLHDEAAVDAFGVALTQAIGHKETTKEALKVVTQMWVPQLVALLVNGIDNNEIRGALDKLAKQFPAAALKISIECALSSRKRAIEGWAVRLALQEPAALPSALAAISEPERIRFEGILAALKRDSADLAQLPALLREPPWTRGVRQQDLPVVEAAQIETEEKIEWSPQALAKAKAYESPSYLLSRQQEGKFPTDLALKASGIERLLQGQPVEPADIQFQSYSRACPHHVLVAPVQTRLLLWNSYPAKSWCSWYDDREPINALLAEYGLAALPGLRSYVQTYPEKGLPLIAEIDSPGFVDIALHAMRNLKKAKDSAVSWVKAHPRTVLTSALPLAFRPAHSAARDNARHAIRWLASNGCEPTAPEIAMAYGPEMSAALDALLSADPLLVLPGKMPKLPNFFVAASFRRPELASGEALPLSAVEHIGSMLTISRLDSPYPGLDFVKASCSRASLAEFAWDLFEAWMASGAPSKEAWAFTALGLFGDDETARRLSPRIREWPGESAHARAVAGLDLLAAIGSDVALMHLNGIAGKVKFKGLQERAKEKIAAVAEARGFSTEELADRLVPDLGLDENGSLELDFGPRKFFVSFDETLKPYVKDAQGARLKDLPKPIKNDEAALAAGATERFKQMKKDAKVIASLQVIRLEMGMVNRRRWSASDFNLFFLEHPLMRHLAARLVWGVYQQDRLQQNFRVAEDWTLADAGDSHYDLPGNAMVGISHILEMPKETTEAFGQVFADYKILQPFKQLGRETYSLTTGELKLTTLSRFADKVVTTGSVMGLVNRGWERGQAQDGGWVGEFNKFVGDGIQVDLHLDPGTIVGDLSYEPKQKLPEVTLRKRGSFDKDGLLTFGDLDPILTSEILRDIDMLAPAKD